MHCVGHPARNSCHWNNFQRTERQTLQVDSASAQKTDGFIGELNVTQCHRVGKANTKREENIVRDNFLNLARSTVKFRDVCCICHVIRI